MNLPERWYRDVWLFAITLLVFLALLNQQSQVDDIQANNTATSRLATRTAKLAKAIQAQRVNTILTNCQDQNDRHDNTIRKLNYLISQIPPGPQREQAETGKAGTILLIDALVTKRDCRQVLKTALIPASKSDLQGRDLDGTTAP